MVAIMPFLWLVFKQRENWLHNLWETLWHIQSVLMWSNEEFKWKHMKSVAFNVTQSNYKSLMISFLIAILCVFIIFFLHIVCMFCFHVEIIISLTMWWLIFVLEQRKIDKIAFKNLCLENFIFSFRLNLIMCILRFETTIVANFRLFPLCLCAVLWFKLEYHH